MGWFLGFAVAATVAGSAISDDQVAHWSAAKGGQTNALTFLVRGKWIEGEAQERGVHVSDTTAKNAADPPEPTLTRHDAIYEARLSLLQAGIQDQITQPAAQSVTPDQVRAYVDAHPKLLPEQRRIRLVRTKTRSQAREAERKIARGLTWKAAQRRYSGGGTTTVQRNDDRFNTTPIFRAATNEIARHGTLVFKVLAVIPPRPMNRAQQEAQAWEILSSAAQQRAVDAFAAQFDEKWRRRTICAASYATAAVCGT